MLKPACPAKYWVQTYGPIYPHLSISRYIGPPPEGPDKLGNVESHVAKCRKMWRNVRLLLVGDLYASSSGKCNLLQVLKSYRLVLLQVKKSDILVQIWPKFVRNGLIISTFLDFSQNRFISFLISSEYYQGIMVGTFCQKGLSVHNQITKKML